MNFVFPSLNRLTAVAALSAALLGGCASMASAPAMVSNGVLTARPALLRLEYSDVEQRFVQACRKLVPVQSTPHV